MPLAIGHARRYTFVGAVLLPSGIYMRWCRFVQLCRRTESQRFFFVPSHTLGPHRDLLYEFEGLRGPYFLRNNHLCDTGRWFFRLSVLDGALLLRQRGPRRVHSSEKKFGEKGRSGQISLFHLPLACWCSTPKPAHL